MFLIFLLLIKAIVCLIHGREGPGRQFTGCVIEPLN